LNVTANTEGGLMIDTLHSHTEQRSSMVAEGKLAGLLAKIKRLIARRFSISREETQGESMLAECRRMPSDVEYQVNSRDF
jgi:hypothetical protein